MGFFRIDQAETFPVKKISAGDFSGKCAQSEFWNLAHLKRLQHVTAKQCWCKMCRMWPCVVVIHSAVQSPLTAVYVMTGLKELDLAISRLILICN